VSSATLLAAPLLTGTSSSPTVRLTDGSKGPVAFNRIGPDYFATMGIPVIAGRAIDMRDRADRPRVVVINEAAAAALFGSESPLGRRLRLFNAADAEVAGVVRDTKYDSVRNAPVPTLFLPYLQSVGPLQPGAMYVVVRTAVAPAALTVRCAASSRTSIATCRSATCRHRPSRFRKRSARSGRSRVSSSHSARCPVSRVHRTARLDCLRSGAPNE
jgi:hypothetical protein